MIEIINTKRERKVYKPINGKEMSLEEMQKIVGGYIQIVPLSKSNKILILDEEGKLKGYPINELATDIWEENYGETDVIVGNVIIADDDEVK